MQYRMKPRMETKHSCNDIRIALIFALHQLLKVSDRPTIFVHRVAHTIPCLPLFCWWW